MFKYLKEFFIIALFIWISFFPQPIQEKYHLFTNIFLILIFLTLFARKRITLFKLSDWPLWVFVIAISINVFFTQHRNVAFKTYLDIALPMLTIYYLVSENFSTDDSLSILVKTISVCSIIVASLGIFECMFRFNPIYKHFIENPYYERYISSFVRPMSTQFHPAVLGSYLIGSLPFNFMLFKQHKSLWKASGALGLLLNTAVIILTFSRGVLLGFMGMVSFYLCLEKKFRMLAILFLILFIFILMCTLLPYPINKFGINLLTRDNAGIISTFRFNRYVMAGRIIKDHPIVGIGFQHFRIRFYEYYPGKDKVSYEFKIADNMYLTFLSETGIMGIGAFLLFIFLVIKKACRRLNKQLLLILSSFVGLLVNMAGYELFYWPNPYIYFCILIGLIEAHFRRPHQNEIH